ncbi:TlpA family protein disulfide reductase [Aquimarina pacifica]|uniref:TlpA family protein disulfide reductase n=1 Tax=Aquimarina pacifica TaxID=1296415 RepID=UPI0004708870|nr:TlpA disulfide reductase family protein [Aquimarina pacifica]
MKFNKKNITNLIFATILVLFFIPNTRGMMQIYLTRIFTVSPDIMALKERKSLESYDWKLHGVNTESMNFNTTKGKVVVLNYWVTWKASSIAETPSLQKLYNDYKDKVEFVFLTTDDDPEIEKYMKGKKYNYPIYRSLSEHPSLFALDGKSFPTTYLINKNGEIVIDKVGPAYWNSDKVREILDALVSE